MIRQTMRSAALAAAGLLLASAASGQVLRQSSSDAALVAAEYFGGEARVVQVSAMDLDRPETENGQQRPYVGLALSVAAVTPGNTADITFALQGATFQQAASPTHLDQRPNANCSGDKGAALGATVVAGGERGSTSVTYRVEAKTELAIGQSICFWVPDLAVTLAPVSAPGATPVVRGVNVTASSIEPVATSGTAFPTKISGATDVDTDMNGTVAGTEVGNAANTDVRILQAAPALTASLGQGGTGYVVDLTDRTKIDRGGRPDPSAADATSATMGLSVGTLSVGVSQMDIFELDGSGLLPKDRVDGSLSGQINLTVGGRFQSGDRLVVGSGPTALSGDIEGMTAEITVQTAVIASMPIAYVPGGVDVLKPGTFMAGAAYLFNDRRNANAPIPSMSQGELKYAGVEVEGYAYGIVKGGGMDTSYVRVTCEHTMDCLIFGDCTGADGTEYFSAAPPVSAGETVAWSSDDIAAVLGGGWTKGRGRCDLHSTGQLSVQHMIRSHDLLINSSTVVGRGLDESRDDKLDTIEMVVDNICASVVGHEGRMAVTTPDDGDLTNEVSGHDATPCKSVLARVIPATLDTNSMGADDNTNGL